MNHKKTRPEDEVLGIIDPMSLHKISVLDVETGRKTVVANPNSAKSLADKRLFDAAHAQTQRNQSLWKKLFGG